MKFAELTKNNRFEATFLVLPEYYKHRHVVAKTAI